MRSITALSVLCLTQLLAQTPNYSISTIAGTNPSGDGAQARGARLYEPKGLAVDAQGNIYFCDSGNGRIRRIGRDLIITTVAGGGDTEPVDGALGMNVSLITPSAVALNGTTLYFSDSAAHAVYSVNLTSGVVTVIAGTTSLSGSSGDGGSAKRARLNAPRGLAYDATVGLLIADSGNHRVRRVDLTTGAISAYAGTGTPGFTGDGAAAIAGQLAAPVGLAFGPDHLLYIADHFNGRVRRVKANGTLETVAGTGTIRYANDSGPATGIAIDPYSIAVAPDGTIYIVEEGLHRIRVVTPAGVLTTLTGIGGSSGFAGDGGLASTARFDMPVAAALDGSGGLVIADSLNHRLRKLTLATQIIDTIAGRNRFGGDAVPASQSLLTEPLDVVYDAAGNLYFADTGNHCVRKITPAGIVTVVAGIGGERGKGAEGVQATLSQLYRPTGIAVDDDGTLYIADYGNSRVRKVTPSGIITTISGSFVDSIYGAYALALNKAQHKLYFTDIDYNQVLSLDLSNSGSVPAVIAGSPNSPYAPGFTGDGGLALASRLRAPEGIAIAANGDIYIVDAGNLRLRKIDSAGIITTVAGNGEVEFTPTDGPLPNSVLSFPSRVAVDAQNNIFVSEYFNRIRRISGNRIDTVAGQILIGFAGDGGPATQARFSFPAGMAVAADGSVAIADSLNHRLRKLTLSTGPVTPVASQLQIRSGNNQTANTGQLLPQALTVLVSSATNQPIAGTAVTFAVTSGTATLSAASVNSGTDGLASVTVTLGATAGPVQVTARSGTLTPVVFSLTATTGTDPGPGPVKPIISSGGIIGVGTSVPAVTTIAARGIISIFGQNFLEAGATGRRVNFDTEMVNGLLPTRLLGVCVDIGGTRAPMLDVFGSQLNVVVPAVTGPTVAVRVIRRCDQSDAVTSDPQTVTVAATAPEFLYSQLNADGKNPVAALNAITNALIGPATLPGFVPAQAGDIVTVYASGFGATDPTILAGGVSAGIANVTASVRVRIGSIDLAPADVLYVGASPSSLIYQVNLRVPTGLAEGNQPIQIFLNNVASPPNAYLAIGAGGASDSSSLEQRLLQRYQSRAQERQQKSLGHKSVDR